VSSILSQTIKFDPIASYIEDLMVIEQHYWGFDLGSARGRDIEASIPVIKV
jgi:hypothetical protein